MLRLYLPDDVCRLDRFGGSVLAPGLTGFLATAGT